MPKTNKSEIILENYQHIIGESSFVYDMDIDLPCLYGKAKLATISCGEIISLDISKAKKLEGVKAVLTFKDIPGKNDASAFAGDEPCLAENRIQYYGEPIALVAANTLEIAEQAIRLIEVEYKEEQALISIDDAIKKQSYLFPPIILQKGEPENELQNADYYFEDILETPAQEHWYLETQCAFAIPLENNEIEIYSSTQNPTEGQEVVSHLLGISSNKITIKTKRIGGGFGGKETWACKPAAWAALLANATRENVYFRLNREEDQCITLKRHPYKIWYKAAFNKDGKLHACVIDCYSNGGCAMDLSFSVMQRTLLHCESAYYFPHLKFTGNCCKTNLLAFGAFRGFGAPQGSLVAETIMEKISEITGINALEVRRKNFFGTDPKNENHYAFYSQPCLANRLFDIEKTLRQTSDYENRLLKIERFNKENQFIKRGIGANMVKFGISFNNTALNQGGALINIYKDGSIQVNHGGIEMGQGITAKIRKIASREFGISEDQINIMTSSTDKVPNTSPTAASTGTDINGMAVVIAAHEIRKRLSTKAAEIFVCDESEICFENNEVINKNNSMQKISFKDLVHQSYWSRISLSSTGYYKTPNIYFDKETNIGHPFAYYVYGMAISEIEVNILTNEMQIIRTDILHDVGKSLNPEIDKGQIEGGFMQGMGYLTMENIIWNEKGKPLNISPDTYKIPTIQDIPLEFIVSLLEDQGNPYAVHQSKATGEPPLHYGQSVYFALKNALKSKN